MGRSHGITFAYDNKRLLKTLAKYQGDVIAKTEECVEKSARIYESELRSLASQHLDSDIVSDITVSFEKNEFEMGTRIGWTKNEEFNPDHVTNVYKAIFANYGTPKRFTKAGAERGSIDSTGFLKQAKENVKDTIHKLQKDIIKQANKEARREFNKR